MTTVTAKELRENLSSIIDRVENGEEIAVVRQSKIAIQLIPHRTPPKSNGKQVAAAIKRYQKYIKDNNITFNADPNKSIKQLYHEALDEKYGR